MIDTSRWFIFPLVVAIVTVAVLAGIGGRCHRYIICDKAMRVRMPHCELKWKISDNLFIMKRIMPKDSGITLADIYRSVISFVGIQAVCLV